LEDPDGLALGGGTSKVKKGSGTRPFEIKGGEERSAVERD